jgi:hypothetical protein
MLTGMLFISDVLFEAEGQELLLKPVGDAHVRQLGAQFLLTCEVEDSSEDIEYKLQWIGTDGREIVETTGRSVCPHIRFRSFYVLFTTLSYLSLDYNCLS